MSDERTIERLLARLRAHVAELRRMEQDGAGPEQVEERRRLIQRLQRHLAYSVVDALRHRKRFARATGRRCSPAVARI